MKDYVIFMDTAGDLSETYIKENDIRLVPMHYTLGKEDRICAKMEDEALLKRFYDGQRGGDLTQTSQITPQVYIDLFEPELKAGRDVIYISLSSGLTKTFDNVNLAKRELEETYKDAHVYPVDSLMASGGEGILTIFAAENRKAGMSAEENAALLAERAHKTNLIFMVDDLMYLKRGGRIPASTAVIGTVLNVKPIMHLDTVGKITPLTKKRGEKMALKELVTIFRKTYDPSMGNYIYINHADCAPRAEKLKEMLLAEFPNLDITTMMMSPIIGAHTGPGMICILYFGDKEGILKMYE